MTDSIVLENGVLTGRIETKLPSMKNSREIVQVRGWGGKSRTMSIKSERARAFFERVRAAYWDAIAAGNIEARSVPLEGPLVIHAKVYQETTEKPHRADLDIESLCDALQGAGLIADDWEFWEKRSRREIDPKRPRVEFTVRPDRASQSGRG